MAVSIFGVSTNEELLKAPDQNVSHKSFTNRWQAIRHLIEKIGNNSINTITNNTFFQHKAFI